jgi:hypothetical protein
MLKNNYNRRTNPKLSLRLLSQYLRYDKQSGNFYWLKRFDKYSRIVVGDRAGTLDGGYIKIWCCKKRYPAHQLAWLFTHGKWPTDHIDHINGDTSDNRIQNLWACGAAFNYLNNKNNRLGKVPGVKKVKDKFQARTSTEGRNIFLGTYDTVEDAHLAYLMFLKRKYPKQFKEYCRRKLYLNKSIVHRKLVRKLL